MPSKTIFVKAHSRTIHSRKYLFVCAHCHQKATRVVWNNKCPKFCARCSSLTKEKGEKPQPIGEIVPDDFELLDTSSPSPKNRTSRKKDSTDSKSLAIELIRQANLKAAESMEKPIDKNSLDDLSEKLPQTRLNSEELIDFVNELFLDTRSNKLNSDERCIIVDLWYQRSIKEIAKKRKFKVKAVIAIQNNLMKQLTQDLKETVTPGNFFDVMTKHYRAYATIKQSKPEN